jgi:hypothetical protein
MGMRCFIVKHPHARKRAFFLRFRRHSLGHNHPTENLSVIWSEVSPQGTPKKTTLSYRVLAILDKLIKVCYTIFKMMNSDI